MIELKKTLYLLNLINIISLLLCIPYILVGSNLFLLFIDDTVSTLCLNQFIVFFIITFILVVYANIKRIYTTRDGFEIIRNSTKPIRILTIILLCICLCIGVLFFKNNLLEYTIICFLHSLSILLCDGIIKKA